jgi:hypothetical protein
MSDWIVNMGNPRPLARQVVEVKIFETDGTHKAEFMGNGYWKTAAGAMIRDQDVLWWRPLP